MSILKRKHTNFYYEFFEKENLPVFFSENEKDQNYFDLRFQNQVHVINCMPTYIEGENWKVNDFFGCFTTTFRQGYLMDIAAYKTAHEYLKDQFSPKVYKNLRQDINRLKRHHDIRFEILYGNSVNQDYFIGVFNHFKKLIKIRFNKLNKNHSAVLRWEEYEENLFLMITKKKASLMILYDGNIAIGISLNYHYKNILDAAITSFDMEYERYGIGKQMFFYQLEWALQNSYEIIDLRWGNYEYKTKFSNKRIRYKTHIIYNKQLWTQKIIAYVLMIAIKWNYKLKEEILSRKNLGN